MNARVVALDHLQLAMPAGGEAKAYEFFVTLLGFREAEKPARLRDSGGLWFESGPVRLHLGVEVPFRAAKKAHPCLVVDDLDGLETVLAAYDYAVTWDDRIPGTRRFFSHDPFGNRLEFMQP